MTTAAHALLLVAASDDIGIYPKAFTKDGVTTERTEWQDGWNACSINLSEKWAKITKWYDALPRETQETIYKMLKEEILYLSLDKEEKIRPWLLMNDTFGYACSDSEEVEIGEMPILSKIYDTHKYDGLIAWAANKRGCEPIKPLITDEYKLALEFVRNQGA